MCELFCLSSLRPTRATFSLSHFAAHGSPDGHNVDGWGVAFHEGRDVRLYKEPEPAGSSPLLVFIEKHSHPTRLLISHIRRATSGTRSFANTHPFARELAGRMHVFAHNGRFDGIDVPFARPGRRFRPVGETDSERAFCLLLERLAKIWEGPAAPSLAARLAVVEAFAVGMRRLGIANFLYSDGEFVFAHGHRRTQADGIVAPPGLWIRHDHRDKPPASAVMAAASPGVIIHHEEPSMGEVREMAVVASVPVTAGHWSPLAEGEIVVVSSGRIIDGAGRLGF